MRFLEGVKIALASLRAHKLRTFLTLLGVIFGVMTVVAVAAVIEGFFRYIDRTVTADLGANTVILDKFGLITSFEEFINANRRNKDITLADADYPARADDAGSEHRRAGIYRAPRSDRRAKN